MTPIIPSQCHWLLISSPGDGDIDGLTQDPHYHPIEHSSDGAANGGTSTKILDKITICIHNIRSGKFNRALHVDAVTQQVQESCAGNGIPVNKQAIHSNGFFLAHLCDGSLHVISINRHQLCCTNIGESLNTMIICPKSETVITGGDKGCVRIWALEDLTLQCTVDVKKNGPITSLAFTPGAEQFLCIGSSNGMLSIVSRIPWEL